MRARWDDDTRGYGVGDARSLAGGADELVAAMRERNWVAEDPEAHLLPHLEAACADSGSRLVLEGARVDDDGSLLVDLRWDGKGDDHRGLRSAVYTLIGAVAEPASYVREGRDGDASSFEVVTGMLAPDTPFAPHGHVLRLRVAASD